MNENVGTEECKGKHSFFPDLSMLRIERGQVEKGEEEEEEGISKLLMNAPKLLRPKGALRILLPGIIKRREEDQVGRITPKALPEAPNRSAVILHRRHSLPIRLPRMRPARLGDDDALSARLARDLARLASDVGARARGRLRGVEEGVAVGRAVVGRFAELGVREEHGEGVDCDDGAGVACWAERVARLLQGLHHLLGGGLAAVDELVADGDGVDGGPVGGGCVDEGL